jgi:hypothetical protein
MTPRMTKMLRRSEKSVMPIKAIMMIQCIFFAVLLGRRGNIHSDWLREKGLPFTRDVAREDGMASRSLESS